MGPFLLNIHAFGLVVSEKKIFSLSTIKIKINKPMPDIHARGLANLYPQGHGCQEL